MEEETARNIWQSPGMFFVYILIAVVAAALAFIGIRKARRFFRDMGKQLRSTFFYYSGGFIVSVPIIGVTVYLICRSLANNSQAEIISAIALIVLVIILCWKAVVPWFRVLHYIRKFKKGIERLLELSGCSTREGPLGTGKTASAGYEITTKSKEQWEKLQFNYKILRVKAYAWNEEYQTLLKKKCDAERPRKGIEKSMTWWEREQPENKRWKPLSREDQKRFQWLGDNLIRWREVKFAYEFWTSRPDCAPCVFANVPITIDGKKVCKFTIDHILQKQRLPAYTCVFCDEIERMVDKYLFNDKSPEVEKGKLFFRFFRHFLGNGGRCIGTEQNAGNVWLAMRNVMASNDMMKEQRNVLKPWLLWRILDKWTERINKRPIEKLTEKKVDRFLGFESWVKGIGFRIFDYSIGGRRIDGQAEAAGGSSVSLHVPMYLNFEYDDRAFRTLYACRDDKLYAQVYHSAFVDPNERALRHDAAVYAAKMEEREAEEREKLKAEKAAFAPIGAKAAPAAPRPPPPAAKAVPAARTPRASKAPADGGKAKPAGKSIIPAEFDKFTA